MIIVKIKKELESLANKKKVVVLQSFFKTGKGEYGEGDVFLGVTVPDQRKLVKKYYQAFSLKELEILLKSEIHEYRMTALLMLVVKYEKTKKEEEKKDIYKFYLANIKWINNWDLVDVTCPKIVGNYLWNNKKEKGILFDLVESENLWERRVAVLACFTFIRNNEFEDILKLAELLLKDEHDLMHKVVGWMLREMGKRDEWELKKFLDKYYRVMPRVMLRYSIEKLDKDEKDFYMGRVAM